MIIRKIDERISEEKLNYISFMNLTNLCNDSNIEYIKELIKLFNDSPTSLKGFEICFLVNYVIKGKVSSVKDDDYALYLTNDKKIKILSAADIMKESYRVVDDNVMDIEQRNEINKIIDDLKQKGFKILESKDFLLAFCQERNVVFYSYSIENALKYYFKESRFYFFKQPRVYDGRKIIVHYLSSNSCHKEKVDFPLFFPDNYLSLYNPRLDKENDNEFVASMKRIAKYPELYDVVGEENQKIIDSIVKNDFGDKYDDIQIESKLVMI